MSLTASSEPVVQGTGRYLVEAELARGGMGVVYRVWDEAERRHKALKRGLLNVREQDGALIEREYRTLISLKHPAIIAAHDFGVDAEGPYYTMELLDGADLRTRSPVPWRDACGYLRDIASSLALLHARLLLHRDVSPLNVRITADGRAKLLDFGALAPFGRQSQIVGTASCVAPEVLEGRELDQSVDLFALGATAYYALTGVVAYDARSIKLLPHMWAQGAPQPPSRHVADVPAALDELVLSLLALDPMARPCSAGEVIDRLIAIAELPREDDERVIQSYLRHPALVGRAETRSRLGSVLARFENGAGTTVLIEGGPGAGKSTQLADFEREARFAGFLVLSVNARAHAAELGACQALVDRALLELGLGAGELEAPILPSRSNPSSSTDSDPVLGIAGTLLALSRGRRVMFSVDDAGHLDLESAAVFARLSKVASQAKLLLAFTASSEDAEGQVALRTVRRNALRLQLDPLSAEDTERLVRSIFGEVPRLRRLSAWLSLQASGTPLVIMEHLAELIEQRRIRYQDGIWSLPQDLDEGGRASFARALQRRLTRVGKPERELAGCLSAQPRSLSWDLCRALSGTELSFSDAQLQAALSELLRENVLVGDRDGYAFAHAQLRDAAYAELEPGRKARLHTFLAKYVIHQAGETDESKLEAAYHYAMAGDGEAAQFTHRDPAIARHLEQVVRSLPILLALQECYERMGVDEFAQLPVTTALVVAGPHCDPSLHERFAEHAFAPLEKRSGMHLASRLRPLLGSKLAILLGMLSAYLWFLLAPRSRRWPTFDYPEAYFGMCASLCHQAALRHDRTTIAAVLKRLELVKDLPLTSPPRHVYEGIALHEKCLDGRFAALAARSDQLNLGLDAVIGLGEGARQQIENGAHFWAARLELAGCGERVLEHIEALTHSQVSADWILAEYLRSAYHLSRGEVVLADQAREALDTLTTRHGQNWTADMLLALDFPLYQLAGDVVGLKRCVQQLETLVTAHPSLMLALQIACSMHEGHRGRPERAIQIYASVEDQVGAFSSPFWSHAQAHWAECLNELSKHKEALEKTRWALAEVGEGGDRFALAYLQLARERATALCGLGQHDVAAAELNALIERHAGASQPLLLGLLHRDRARVALVIRDAEAFALHSAQANAAFAGTKNPALRAQMARLLEQGLDKELTSNLDGVEKRQLAEASELKAALSTATGTSLSTEERLLEYVARLTGAARVRLYGVAGPAPALIAQRGADAWAATLQAELEDLVTRYIGSDGMETLVTEAATSIGVSVAHELYPLTLVLDDRRVLVALLVVADAPRARELNLTRLDLFARVLSEPLNSTALTARGR